ncbi:MAG: prolipoprotein diacylglyceryl transferase [Myxococcota bacterium]
MLPVLYRFVFDTDLSKVLLYVFAFGLVVYAAWNGWNSAEGPPGKDGKPTAPSQEDRRSRAIMYGLFGVGLAAFGLYYALPNVPVLGRGKGEGIPIHTYGVMIGLGFITAVTAAAWIAVREWPGQEGIERRNQIFDLAFYLFVGGIVGSRVLFIMVNWKDYAAHPAKIFDLGGGLVFYGGLIGAAIAAVWFSRKHDMQFFRLADIAMPLVSLGQAFGRLGCFSAGCCWGDVTTHARAPFAVEFPGPQAQNLFGGVAGTPSLAYSSMADASNETRWVIEKTGEVFPQAVEGAVRISEWASSHGHTLPVHPTQLYESLGQMILFAVLMTARRWRRFHGQIFAIWLMCYAVLRTSVELFRGDLERGTLHGLFPSIPTGAWYNVSTSQGISLAMFSFGAYLLIKNLREIKAQPAIDLQSLTAA